MNGARIHRRIKQRLLELEAWAWNVLVNGDRALVTDQESGSRRRLQGLGEHKAAALVNHVFDLPRDPAWLDSELSRLTDEQRAFLLRRELWDHSWWDRPGTPVAVGEPRLEPPLIRRARERQRTPEPTTAPGRPIQLAREQLAGLAAWDALPEEDRQSLRNLIADDRPKEWVEGCPALKFTDPESERWDLFDRLARQIHNIREIRDCVEKGQDLEALDRAADGLMVGENIVLAWIARKTLKGRKGRQPHKKKGYVLERWRCERDSDLSRKKFAALIARELSTPEHPLSQATVLRWLPADRPRRPRVSA